MTTISRLYKNKDTRGEIAVNKTYMVPVESLFIEDGFNVRELDQDHVSSICESYKRGDYIPPIVVEPQEDGMMKIIDGHHRYSAVKKAILEGVEIKRLQCEGFTGDKADQLAYMIKSSQGRNLSPIERGMAYKRFESHGFTRDEIADKVCRSRADIDHHINIAELPQDVKNQVASGEISASLALELCNKAGSEAVTQAVEKAKADGKKKATKKHTSLWKPKMGKEIVSFFSGIEAQKSTVDDSVDIRLSEYQWEKIQEALAALSDNSNN